MIADDEKERRRISDFNHELVVIVAAAYRRKALVYAVRQRMFAKKMVLAENAKIDLCDDRRKSHLHRKLVPA